MTYHGKRDKSSTNLENRSHR